MRVQSLRMGMEDSMKKRQHTTEQIIRKLEEGDRRLAEGLTIEEVCKHLEITPSTWFRWRNQFGGLKADDAKELRELRKENGRLKKIVADQALDIDISGDRPGKLLTPNRRRAAVTRLEERFGVSERRACAVVGQARSTQRLAPPAPSDDELRAFLRTFSAQRPRWGWRRALVAAREAGYVVNHKKIQRLWREEGLKVPYRKRKKPPRGIGVRVGAMCPIAPDVIWAMDFQFDQTADGRQLKLLNVVDEFTRERLAIEVERSIDADHVVRVLERLARERRAPRYVRFDNGPEFIAHAVADWCRFNGTGTLFIDPGSPWQNPVAESSNGRLRDEILNHQLFDSLFEAKVLLEDHRIDHNRNRTHSAHGWKTPAAFAEQWLTRQQQLLAS